MFESLAFRPGDPAIRRFLVPPDYMSRVRDTFVAGYGDDVLVNPNAWVVDLDNHAGQLAAEGLWRLMMGTIGAHEPYQTTLVMPLRTEGAIASLIHFGDGTELTPPALEGIRLELVQDVNRYAPNSYPGL